MTNKITRFFELAVHKYANIIGWFSIFVSLFFLWVPLLVVFVMSFSESSALGFPPDNITLHWYYQFINNEAVISSMITTMQVSIVATPISVLLAILFSYAVDRYYFKGKNIYQLLVLLPIMVPLVVTGVSLSLFYGVINLGGGFWQVVFSHVMRSLPFAALVILPTFASFDSSLEEAAMDLGATKFKSFLTVTLPNILPGIIAGTLIAFTVSFNEFIYTYFVRSTGFETLPIYLWNEVNLRATPEINVISTVFIVFVIVIITITLAITKVENVINA